MKKFLLYFVITIFSLLFFSYRLTQVPDGLTIDEAAFGYNAVLLSETLHDENNRFLPVFVLSLNAKDWRQPVTQYFMTGFFKTFGPSIYNLKYTSVIVATIGSVLICYLGKLLLGTKGGLLSLILYITTPIVMIHSHLALDNIYPIPFTILWLIFLYLYEKSKNPKLLFFSAVSLGIGFYSYKAMRIFVTSWSVITLIYLNFPHIKNFKKLKKALKPTLAFCFGIVPFYAITPLLEYKYAGAVFDRVSLKIDSVYQFLYYYLSTFDLSFLFIQGDTLPHHTTGSHGMFLLASMPFFLIGILQAIKKDRFWKFLLITFFLSPLLFGFTGSVHRASRLIALIPIYTLIASLGALYLWSKNGLAKTVALTLIVIFAFNYYDFIKYYWYSYPKDTYNIFYHPEKEPAYKTLFDISTNNNLTPYVDHLILEREFSGEDIVGLFTRSLYFPSSPGIWKENLTLPKNSVLMSRNASVPELKKVNTKIPDYFFYMNYINTEK